MLSTSISRSRKTCLIIILSLFLFTSFHLVPVLAQTADDAPAEDNTHLYNPLPFDNLPDFVGSVLKYLLGFLGTVALIIFLYGGWTWMTSAGDPKKVTKGRDTILWAALGVVVIFLSYALVVAVFNLVSAGTA